MNSDFASIPSFGEVRAALVSQLADAQELINQSLSDVDFGRLWPEPSEELDYDVARDSARFSNGLLLRKIGFHIVALLQANEQNNVTSLGVHARVIIECAAELMLIGRAAAEEDSEAYMRSLNNLEYAANSWLWKVSRGTVTKAELEAKTIRMREHIGIFDGKQPTKVYISDRVSELAGGRGWYKYLSDCFCHPTPDKLRNAPGLGGVLPAPAFQYDLATTEVLGCALTYACQSLLAYGVIRIKVGDGSQCFDDAIALSNRMEETATLSREMKELILDQAARHAGITDDE